MSIENLSEKVKAALDGIADEFALEQAKKKTDGQKIAEGLASMIDRTIENRLKSVKIQKEEKRSSRLEKKLDEAKELIGILLEDNKKLESKNQVAKVIQKNILFHIRGLMEEKLSSGEKDFLTTEEIADCINKTQFNIDAAMFPDATSILSRGLP